MRSISPHDLAEIEPFSGEAFKSAVERLIKSPLLPTITKDFFPNVELEELKKIARATKNGNEFEKQIMYIAVKSILNRSSDGFTYSGFEELSGSKKYLFISNHRDILGDAALLSFCLLASGYTPPNVCLGDNLLFNDWATDLMKVNKGIIVKRNLSQRELLRWSMVLSETISQRVKKGEDSVWLAQKEGRSKDGRDATHPGLIKMLGLRAESGLMDHFQQLNVVPVSISYEYDPCAAFKARELILKEQEGEYKKAPDEDKKSMGMGMLGYKGRVHIEGGAPLTSALEALRDKNKKEQIEGVVRLLDEKIIAGYRLWPCHFIAFDTLNGGDRFTKKYTEDDKLAFFEQIKAQVALVEDVVPALLTQRILEAYANPLKAKLVQTAPLSKN